MYKLQNKRSGKDPDKPLRIDIGCGTKKREGFIGVDKLELEGVDFVCDLDNGALPFSDESAEYIYSSHFVEHLRSAHMFWREVGRVAKTKAVIEIWCPHGNTNEADINGHELRWNELWWQHLAITARDHYANKFLGGKHWHWHEVSYVIDKDTEQAFKNMQIPLDFALKHLNNACREWGVFLQVEADRTLQPTEPLRTYSHSRGGERRYVLSGEPVNEPTIGSLGSLGTTT